MTTFRSEKMDWVRLEYLYCDEIAHLCVKASAAMSVVHVESLRDHPSAALIHMNVETLLECCHRVSLAMFPRNWARKKKTSDEEFSSERASRLRKILGVSTDSTLNDRSLRNHTAHFDERIDQWFRTSLNRTYGRHMLGALENVEKLKIRREDVMSMFDPVSGGYYFWNDSVNVYELEKDMKLIEIEARKYLATVKWEGLQWKRR